MAVIEVFFKAIGDWRIGKQAEIFKSFAKELGCLVLTNKTYQITRFVASLIQGLRAVTQNLPTMIALYAKAFNKAALECDNTKAKEIEQTLKTLMNPKNLVWLIGLQQILEKYTSMSLTAQSSTNPPPAVWAKVLETQEELRILGTIWVWKDEDLLISCTEAPRRVVDRLVRDSIYRPKVARANVRCYRDLEEAGLINENEQINDLFLDEESIKPLAGETLMDKLSEGDLANVEEELKEAAQSLVELWEERQIMPELDKAVLKAFGSVHNDIPGIEGYRPIEEWRQMFFINYGASKTVQEVNEEIGDILYKYFTGLVQAIPENLPQEQQTQFPLEDVSLGFMKFNNTWIIEQDKSPEKKLLLKDVYEEWFKQFAMFDDSDAEMKLFSKFYQNLMVRSVSEAFCETVGSVMKMKTARGRNLSQENLSDEVCLDINLGPLHMMEPLVEKVNSLRNREYHYRRKPSGAFASWDLKEYQLGAAVRGMRKVEESKSRLPLQVWARWQELTE